MKKEMHNVADELRALASKLDKLCDEENVTNLKMTISEVSKLLGLKAHTVRRITDLTPQRIKKGGRRFYDRKQVEKYKVSLESSKEGPDDGLGIEESPDA